MPRVYECIARAFIARKNCEENGTEEWFERHSDRIEQLVHTYLPSGSGFDLGTSIDWDASRPDRLVFNTAFHHMDENGYYDGWTDYQVICRASLAFGFDLRITGRDRRDIKDYIHDAFHSALDRMLETEY